MRNIFGWKTTPIKKIANFGVEIRHNSQFNVSIWCALRTGEIILPYLFKNDAKVQNGRCFIPQFNDLNLEEFWYQQDYATMCHYVEEYVNTKRNMEGSKHQV